MLTQPFARTNSYLYSFIPIQFLTGIVYLYLQLDNVLFVNLYVIYTVICIGFVLLFCCNLIGYTTD